MTIYQVITHSTKSECPSMQQFLEESEALKVYNKYQDKEEWPFFTKIELRVKEF